MPASTTPLPEQPWIEPRPLPDNLLGSFDELLRSPEHVLNRARTAERRREVRRLFGGAVAMLLAYGLAAGFFEGGFQILIAGLKTPVIVLGAMLLCMPSLYVFSALAGADLSRERFWTGAAGFLGLISLLMIALLPVNWLFSVSSRSLWFVMMLHMGVWQIASLFAYRFLQKAFFPSGRAAVLLLWSALFFCVAFQVTTVLRPVLWRAPGGPLIETGKETFLEHWGNAMSFQTPQEQPGK
jgi:hypothetical protein